MRIGNGLAKVLADMDKCGGDFAVFADKVREAVEKDSKARRGRLSDEITKRREARKARKGEGK